jgi:hypothetical protein
MNAMLISRCVFQILPFRHLIELARIHLLHYLFVYFSYIFRCLCIASVVTLTIFLRVWLVPRIDPFRRKAHFVITPHLSWRISQARGCSISVHRGRQLIHRPHNHFFQSFSTVSMPYVQVWGRDDCKCCWCRDGIIWNEAFLSQPDFLWKGYPYLRRLLEAIHARINAFLIS